jgi:N-methylhydantoinase A
MAQELDLQWVLTPSVASVLSAYGAATADIQRERSVAIDEVLPEAAARANEAIAALKERADADLAHQNVSPENRQVVCEVDLRFYRQRNSLTLTLESGHVEPQDLMRRFQDAYAKQYGLAGLTGDSQVELSNVRVIGIGRTIRAVLPNPLKPREPGAALPSRGTRTLQIGRNEQSDIPVYDAEMLLPGDEVRGPALLDKADTTLWAPRGSVVSVEANGSLITRFEGTPR